MSYSAKLSDKTLVESGICHRIYLTSLRMLYYMTLTKIFKVNYLKLQYHEKVSASGKTRGTARLGFGIFYQMATLRTLYLMTLC